MSHHACCLRSLQPRGDTAFECAECHSRYARVEHAPVTTAPIFDLTFTERVRCAVLVLDIDYLALADRIAIAKDILRECK